MKIDSELFNDPDESLDKEAVEAVLDTWASFTAGVGELNTKELYVAFRKECVQLNRSAIKQRLIQRIRVKVADQIETFLHSQDKSAKRGD